MTAVSASRPTGRTVRTYYNTGTYAVPVWTQIALVDAEKFRRGEKSFFQTTDRSTRVERQAEGKTSRASIEFDYTYQVGVADTVFAALLAACAAGAAPKELCIAEDDMTLTGVDYWRGFFSITITKRDRPTDGFVKVSLKGTEVEHYESTARVVLTKSTTTPP